MRKLYASIAASALTAAIFVQTAFAQTADPALEGAVGQVTGYFSDNIGVVIGAIVAIALLVWLLGIAFRSVGVRRPNKVG